MSTKKNREAWLLRAVPLLAARLRAAGATVPAKIRVSCGFPKGNRGKNTAIGQCWYSDASADQHYEIFVSPVIADGTEVLAILAHELCHAALPTGTGHKAPFKRLAYAIGLEGKPRSTVAGPAFRSDCAEKYLPKLGAYPHAELRVMVGEKKQTTRLLKVECPACGYTVRVTQKWLDIGLPRCPEHDEMEVAQ